MNIKKAKLKITIYWQRFSSCVSRLKSVSSETVVTSIMWPSASVPHFLKCTILRSASVFQVILEGKKLLESSCSSIVYLLLSLCCGGSRTRLTEEMRGREGGSYIIRQSEKIIIKQKNTLFPHENKTIPISWVSL